MTSEKLKHYTSKAIEGAANLIFYGVIITGVGLLGKHCCYERKTITYTKVVSVESNCGVDGDTGIEFCVRKIEIDKKGGCLYVPNRIIDLSNNLKVGDKLEELKWYRDIKCPFLNCDMVDSYKKASE